MMHTELSKSHNVIDKTSSLVTKMFYVFWFSLFWRWNTGNYSKWKGHGLEHAVLPITTTVSERCSVSKIENMFFENRQRSPTIDSNSDFVILQFFADNSSLWSSESALKSLGEHGFAITVSLFAGQVLTQHPIFLSAVLMRTKKVFFWHSHYRF